MEGANNNGGLGGGSPATPSGFNEEEMLRGLDESLGENATFADFMGQIETHFNKLIAASYTAPKDAWEHWLHFQSAVNWEEWWIRGLLASHVLLLVLVLLLRKDVNAQTIIFFMICVLVLLAERINSYCAQSWQSFATQNYFDKHGAFITVMMSAPLLFIALVQLINFVVLSFQTLVEVKRNELKNKMKKNSTATTTSNNTAAATTTTSDSNTAATVTATSNTTTADGADGSSNAKQPAQQGSASKRKSKKT